MFTFIVLFPSINFIFIFIFILIYFIIFIFIFTHTLCGRTSLLHFIPLSSSLIRIIELFNGLGFHTVLHISVLNVTVYLSSYLCQWVYFSFLFWLFLFSLYPTNILGVLHYLFILQHSVTYVFMGSSSRTWISLSNRVNFS